MSREKILEVESSSFWDWLEHAGVAAPLAILGPNECTNVGLLDK